MGRHTYNLYENVWILSHCGPVDDPTFKRKSGFWPKIEEKFFEKFKPDQHVTAVSLRIHWKGIINDPKKINDCRAGRKCKRRNSLQDEDLVDTVLENLEKKPRLSYTERQKVLKEEVGLDVSERQIRRIAAIAGYRSYKPIAMQSLEPQHKEKRLKMAEKIVKKTDAQIKKLVVSDEALFNCTNPTVNSQNSRYLAKGIERVDPEFYREAAKVQGGKKIMVFGALCWGKRPYVAFVEGSITMENYQDYVSDMLVDGDFGFRMNWHTFQQDGAPAHRARDTLEWLEHFCGNRIMAQGYQSPHFPEWSPRSPDLSVCDFFFWGYIKSELHKKGWPRSVEDMKEAILEVVDEIPQTMINNACLSFKKRCQLVIDQKGSNFEHLL